MANCVLEGSAACERLFLKGLRAIEDPSGWILGLFEAVSHSKISFVV